MMYVIPKIIISAALLFMANQASAYEKVHIQNTTNQWAQGYVMYNVLPICGTDQWRTPPHGEWTSPRLWGCLVKKIDVLDGLSFVANGKATPALKFKVVTSYWGGLQVQQVD